MAIGSRAGSKQPQSDANANGESKVAPSSVIHRRRLLKTVGIGSTALLAGCSGQSEEDGSNNQTNTTDPGPVQNGGHLRFANPTGPNSLHPMKGSSAIGFVVNDLGYSRLTAVDTDLNVQPALAKDWDANSDKTEWTFNLHSDAKFAYNGKQVTASDVKATFELMMNPDRASGAQKDTGPLEGVEVVDEKTAKFNLKKPRADYPLQLTESGSYSQILPKEKIEGDYDAMAENTFGSGPFVLEEFQTDDHYTFVRNDDYFLTDEEGNQLPYVDKITLQVLPEAVTRINSMQDDRIDCLHSLSQSMVSRVKNAQGINEAKVQTSEFHPIALNTTVDPLGNVNVRKAIKCGIDRTAVSEGVPKLGKQGNHSPISPIQPYYTEVENSFGPEAKADKAQSFLKEAGHDGGIELPPLYYSKGYSDHEIIATLAQQQLGKVGIEFEIKGVPNSKWLSEMWNKDGYWYVSKWAGRILPGTVPEISLHSEASWNATRFSDNEFDKTIENAIAATDKQEKKKLFKRAQQILHERGTYVVPGFQISHGASNNYVNNYEMNPVTNRNFEYFCWLSSEAPTKK